MRVCLNCVVQPRASHVVPAIEGSGSMPPHTDAVPTGVLWVWGAVWKWRVRGRVARVKVEKGSVRLGATGLRLNRQPWGYGEASLARKWTMSRTWGEKNTPQNTPQTNKNNKEKR